VGSCKLSPVGGLDLCLWFMSWISGSVALPFTSLLGYNIWGRIRNESVSVVFVSISGFSGVRVKTFEGAREGECD